jgi:hypothetical protein
LSSRIRLWLAIGGLLAAALGTQGTASAETVKAGGFTYVSQFATVPNGGDIALGAKCPGDTHIISGGFYNSGLDYNDFQINGTNFSDLPNDADSKPDDIFIAVQHNNSGQEALVFSHAVCVKKMPKYRSRTVQLAGDQATTINEQCNGEETPFYTSVNPSNGLPFSFIGFLPPSRRFDDLFSTTVDNTQLNAISAQVITVCLKAKVKPVKGALGTVSGLTRKDFEVKCPRGTFVVSGGESGAGVESHENGEVVGSFPRPPRTFQGAFSHYDLDGSVSQRTNALCMKPL